MQCAEYRDLVAAHVDAQLSREEEVQALAHLAACAACARLLDTQRAFVRTLRARSFVRATPEPLRRSILARVEASGADRQVEAQRSRWWSRPVVPMGLAAAVALILLAVVVPRFGSHAPAPPPGIFDTLVDHYRAVESGRITLKVHTDDPTELRAYYLQTGAFTFRNTVVDLEPLGLPLVGGTVSELAGKSSTLSVYRGGRGMVLCQRIQSSGVELPAGGEMVGGDRFYSVGDITICVHLEGDIICFMASTIPRPDFIRLLAGHA